MLEILAKKPKNQTCLDSTLAIRGDCFLVIDRSPSINQTNHSSRHYPLWLFASHQQRPELKFGLRAKVLFRELPKFSESPFQWTLALSPKFI